MKKRFKVLDIFRGIFSTMIVLFHMSAFSRTRVINNSLIYNSQLFVDFFFVLSGFVIAYNYTSIATTGQFKTFLKRRFFRLYPLHIIVLLMFLLIEALKPIANHYVHVNQLNNANNNLLTVFTNIFLVNSVKVPGITDVSWNIASWSISAEMIAYSCFGLLMLVLHKFKLLKLNVLLNLLIIAGALTIIYTITGSFNTSYNFDYGFLRGIMGFFTGVVCIQLYQYSVYNLQNLNKAFFTIAEVVCVIASIGMVCYGTALKNCSAIYLIPFFATIFIFAFERGYVSGLLKRSKVLNNMGKYSYSIYMIHTLILSLFNILFLRVIKLPPSSYFYLFVVNYIVIYYISSWTFKNIEMRFNLPKVKADGKKAWWVW